MKNKVLFLAVAILGASSLKAQLNVGSTIPADASAILQATSTTKGFLPPVMTTTQINAIVLPANGLTVYNSTLSQLQVNVGTTLVPSWSVAAGGANVYWSQLGNTGTVPGTNYIGTTDNASLGFRTNGIERVRVDSSTGNVGIGTSPVSKLDVNGTILARGGSILTMGNATAIGWSTINGGIGESEFVNYSGTGPGGFKFYHVGGIGTPSNSSPTASIGSGGDFNSIGTSAGYSSTDRSRLSRTSVLYSLDGIARIYGSQNGDLFTIDSVGNTSVKNTLKIGTATSGAITDSILTINSSTGIVNKRSVANVVGANWGTTGNTGTVPGTNYIGTTDNSSFGFRTNGVERMRIDSSNGHVGIGLNGGNANQMLTIGNVGPTITSSPTVIKMDGTYSSVAGQKPKLILFGDTALNSAYGFGSSVNQLDYVSPVSSSHVFYTAGTEKMRINATGYQVTGTGYISGHAGISSGVDANQALSVGANGGGLVVQGNGAIGGQGAFFQWNRSSGGGETSILNQSGVGGGGIIFGASTNANVVSEWGRFNSAGSLGIGTTAPSTTLHVIGAIKSGADNSGSVRLDPGNGGRSGYISFYQTNGTTRLGYIGYDNTNINYQAENGAAHTFTGGNAIFGNNVGIGTTTPATKLQVISADNTAATNIIDAQANNLTAGTSLWYGGIRSTGTSSNNSLSIDSKGSGNILLNSNGSTGYVGIGTNGPQSTLDVNGTILARGGSILTLGNATAIGWNTINGGYGESEFVNYSGGGPGGFKFYHVGGIGAPTSGGAAAYIAPNGAYSQISDERAKTNIKTVANGLATIMALRPVSYNLHLDRSLKNGVVTFGKNDKISKQFGFSAQELYKVIPEAVEKPKDVNNDFYTVSYTTVIPILTKAIQEQQAQIEATVAISKAQATEIALLKKENLSIAAQLADMKDLKIAMAAMQSELSKIAVTKVSASNIASK